MFRLRALGSAAYCLDIFLLESKFVLLDKQLAFVGVIFDMHLRDLGAIVVVVDILEHLEKKLQRIRYLFFANAKLAK